MQSFDRVRFVGSGACMAMWRLAAGVVVGLCPTRCPVFPERCSRWYQDDFKPLQMASRLYEQNQLDAVLEMRDAENIGIGENLRMNLLPMFMFAVQHHIPVILSSQYAPFLCGLANVTHAGKPQGSGWKKQPLTPRGYAGGGSNQSGTRDLGRVVHVCISKL